MEFWNERKCKVSLKMLYQLRSLIGYCVWTEGPGGEGAVVAGNAGILLESRRKAKKGSRIVGCQAEIRAQIFPIASNTHCCLLYPTRRLLPIFLQWVRKAQYISCILTSRGTCTRHATPPASSWPPYIGDVNPANDAAATANYPASCCEL